MGLFDFFRRKKAELPLHDVGRVLSDVHRANELNPDPQRPEPQPLDRHVSGTQASLSPEQLHAQVMQEQSAREKAQEVEDQRSRDEAGQSNRSLTLQQLLDQYSRRDLPREERDRGYEMER